MANAKAVASASPNNALQGDTLTVEVTDPQGAFSDQSQVQFNPPEHITVNSITPVSPTVLQVNLTIDGAAVTGARDMFVGTPPDNFSLAVFRVNLKPAAAPLVAFVIPGQAAQDTDQLWVDIHGQETNWDATSTVNFGTGITVSTPTALSPTLINARLTVAQSSPTGPHSVTVTTGAEIASGFGVFSVTPRATIVSIVPNPAARGNTYRMRFTGSGSHFGAQSTLAFSGLGITVITSTLVAVSPTILECDVTFAPTTGTGYRLFSITSALEFGRELISYPTMFSIEDLPRLVSITPNIASQGGSVPVQVVGQFTNFSGGSQLSFSHPGVTASNVGVLNATTLVARANVALAAVSGPCDVIVTTGTEVAIGAGLFRVILATDKAIILRESTNTYLRQNHITDPTTVNTCELFIEAVHQALRQQQVLHTATAVTVTVDTTTVPFLQEAVTLREATNTYLRQNHITDPAVVDICEEFIEAVNQAMRDDLAGAGSGVAVVVGVET